MFAQGEDVCGRNAWMDGCVRENPGKVSVLHVYPWVGGEVTSEEQRRTDK